MADAKDTKWQVYRPEWYNERILETYISSPIIDKQNDKIGTDTIKESMDFYMKYGVYSYKHEEMPVGLPLAYKVKDGKVKIRVGVHNKLPMHNRVWEEMKIYGDKGGSSIRGEAEKQEKICEGDVCHNNISELSLWSVSWVGNRPANPEATVTEVAAAKADEPIKLTKQVTLDEVEGMLEKIIARRGKKYCLFAKKDRRLLGCHSTRAGAVNQERAIQARRFSKMNESLDDILGMINKAEYQGRKVELNKPFRLKGENKKFGVYAKNEKGNTVQVKFGDPKMDIKRDSPEKRRNFRARHNCDSPGPKHKAKYWSCKMWSTSSVTDILGKIDKHIWDIAGIRKCKVQKGIDKISKAPRTGRTQRGMRAFMAACVANAKQHLRNYDGLQNVKKPRAFCAELWRDPGSFPGRGPKMSPSRVRDQSGRAFQRAMSRGGWTPKERLRRGKTPSWNKKKVVSGKFRLLIYPFGQCIYMTECTCGGNHAKSEDEVIVATEEVELAAGLEEPVELGKEEALMKDMETTLAKLKEVLAYLEDMGEEKAEEDEEEEEEEPEEEEEEEEEEEKMYEEKEEEKSTKLDDLEKSLATLKKHGINVYTGKKATPAPAPKAEEQQKIDFLNVSKSLEEIDNMKANKNLVEGF